MPLFTNESLDLLRQRIDIVDVIASHVELKRAGGSYKACCPFHDEKTPSFMVQRGDSHYHCYGCGAHGDAIQFLMEYQKMSFSDAVEYLAQKFNVALEKTENVEYDGVSKKVLKETLEEANRFFQCMLLYTEEGHRVLQYLYNRDLDEDFIRRFELGLAPSQGGLLRNTLKSKNIGEDAVREAGLLNNAGRDFFFSRITFPIRDAAGSVIGFSARKYRDETFGGKYINTGDTRLFKKSSTLFGLNYCRRRIAKERHVIIVEGQVDALKLIQAGFDVTVAALGTAFGEGHVKQLVNLGVSTVYLAMDGDTAGNDASSKVGDMFQKVGVGVRVLRMPPGSDPDTILTEKGVVFFNKMLKESVDYLTFLVEYFSKKMDINSPAGKQELVNTISKKIRNWENSVMVHESLRRLASLLKVPEHLISSGDEYTPQILIRKTANAGVADVDPDRILESDLLRWVLMSGGEGQKFLEIAQRNLKPEDFLVPICQEIYQKCYYDFDLLSLAKGDGQEFLDELSNKKINKDRAEQHFLEVLRAILERNWMLRCEDVRIKIISGQHSEDKATELVRQFTELKKDKPFVKTEDPELLF
jgi:DNA primase